MRSIVRASLLALLAASTASADLASRLAPGARESPGLGSDPFASAIRDLPGWGGLEARDAGPVAISHRVSQPLLQTATGNLQWRSHESRVRAAHAQAWSRRTLHVTMERRSPGWNASVGTGAADLRGFSSDAQTLAGLALENAIPGLTLGAHASDGTLRGQGRTSPLGIGARFAPTRGVQLQAALEREVASPALEIEAGRERFAAASEFRTDVVHVELETRGGSRIDAQLGYRRTRLDSPRSSPAPEGYWLEGESDAELWQSALLVRLLPALRVVVRRTDGDASLRSDARFDGQRFGRLSYLRGGIESWLGGVEWASGRRRWVADVERWRVRGGGRATVEAWPFTDLLGDLLAPQENALFRADVRAWRSQLGFAFAARSGVRVSAAVHGYDLLTDASLIRWRPAFLVFGVVDRRETALDVSRVQLGAVSLGATIPLAGFEISADGRQFVFAKLFRGAGSAAPEGSASGPAPVVGRPALTSSRERGWPGGSFFTAAIRRPW